MTQEREIAELAETDRAALHGGFIAHDAARHQLAQVITILSPSAKAATLVKLLEQVRDGYDVLPKALRAHIERQSNGE